MACFNGSSVVLLITMTLFLLTMTPTCGAVKTRHVRVTSELEGGLTLTVHCKSKDDDLGIHVLHQPKVLNGQVHFIGSIYMLTQEITKFVANVIG
ncbi:hypothetical protein Pyn_39714 [Prunus yedoensis var. nudiflora]|uniref:S-protein homolog n=1 Tax=Prunus yedoensis var. nudiflora TaxID=2094558 RepID=A0A314XZ94_PRUYE|nr:hypothetical protein Pyn_39714 [Prunus yedoensis var. nudiflora]